MLLLAKSSLLYQFSSLLFPSLLACSPAAVVESVKSSFFRASSNISAVARVCLLPKPNIGRSNGSRINDFNMHHYRTPAAPSRRRVFVARPMSACSCVTLEQQLNFVLLFASCMFKTSDRILLFSRALFRTHHFGTFAASAYRTRASYISLGLRPPFMSPQTR